jgi:hypothetical protein
MRRLALPLLLLLLTLTAAPALAQTRGSRAVDFIPSSVAGILRLNVSDPAETLQGLNAALFTGSQLQRERLTYEGEPPALEAALPLRDLFRTDSLDAILDAAILPWAAGEIVVAYADFDERLRASAEDILLVIPSEGMLAAASGLGALVDLEPAPEQRLYRGVNLYVRRGIAIANTSPAVFIGPEALVQQALDVQAGARESLGASATYQAVAAAADPEAFLFAYAQGAHVLTGFSGVISGAARAEDLYGLLGGLLRQTRGGDAFETRLLDGGFDAVGINLRAEFAATGGSLNGEAFFHPVGGSALAQPEAESPALDARLLEYIPRNALLAGQGGDLGDLLEDGIAALPLTNFARQMIALPIPLIGTDAEFVTVPSTAEALTAQATFFDLLRGVGDLDLLTEVVEPLRGPYALALLPRPNDPLPLVNSPADLLIVAQPADIDAARAGLGKLLPLLFGVQALEPLEGDDARFQRFAGANAILFSLGVVDDRLIFSTGLEAAGLAVIAGEGENRLVNLEPWQNLTADFPATWLLDIHVFYNTFFPRAAGQVPALDARTRLALGYAIRADGLHTVSWRAAFPVG